MTKLWVLTLAAAATYYALRLREQNRALRAELEGLEHARQVAVIKRAALSVQHQRLTAILAAERRGHDEVKRLLNDAHHRELAWQCYHFARTGDRLTHAPPAVIGSAGQKPHREAVKKFSLADLLAWTGPDEEDGA